MMESSYIELEEEGDGYILDEIIERRVGHGNLEKIKAVIVLWEE